MDTPRLVSLVKIESSESQSFDLNPLAIVKGNEKEILTVTTVVFGEAILANKASTTEHENCLIAAIVRSSSRMTWLCLRSSTSSALIPDPVFLGISMPVIKTQFDRARKVLTCKSTSDSKCFQRSRARFDQPAYGSVVFRQDQVQID